MGRKTTAWVFQVTNLARLHTKKSGNDKEREKPHERK